VTEFATAFLGYPYPSRIRTPPNVRTIDVLTPPAVEPITLAAAKQHMRVTNTAHDAIIPAYIAAARQHVENVTGLGLVLQQWLVSFDRFELAAQKLPGGRIVSVDLFEYTDALGATQTLAVNTDYLLDPIKGRVFLPLGAWRWPVTGCVPGAVRVKYKVGATPNTAGEVTIDAALYAAILLIAADLFENREASGQGANVIENPTVDRLLYDYTHKVAL